MSFVRSIFGVGGGTSANANKSPPPKREQSPAELPMQSPLDRTSQSVERGGQQQESVQNNQQPPAQQPKKVVSQEQPPSNEISKTVPPPKSQSGIINSIFGVRDSLPRSRSPSPDPHNASMRSANLERITVTSERDSKKQQSFMQRIFGYDSHRSGGTPVPTDGIDNEKLPQKTGQPDPNQKSRPESAVTEASRSAGQNTTSPDRLFTSPDQAHLIKESELLDLKETSKDEQKQALDDIAKVILNSRKVEYQNELGFVSENDEAQALRSNNMKFEIRFKDNNGRSIIHRAAFDHQQMQMMDVIDALEPHEKKREIEFTDIYGNTPLILACIRRFDDQKKQEAQYNVVKTLLIQGNANPNVMNPNTDFTPLHWACIHGANDIIKILLENHAKQYVADKKGLFPVDYAGMFKRNNTVRLLIDYQLKQLQIERSSLRTSLKEKIEVCFLQTKNPGEYAFDNQKAQQILRDFWSIYFAESATGVSQLCLFSPLFHTSLLYWAAMFDNIDIKTMKRIINEMEAYPEGPVKIDQWRSPCHAATQVGNDKKLKELMVEVNLRYTKGARSSQGKQSNDTLSTNEQGLSIDQGSVLAEVEKLLKLKSGTLTATSGSGVADPLDKYKKANIIPEYEQKWGNLSRGSRYFKLRRFNTFVFQAKLLSYRKQAEEVHNQLDANQRLNFDFLDKNLNTPLHIASQFGNAQCIEVLLIGYHLQIDLRNIHGWMAKDIIQYDSVKEAYRQHYRRMDQELRTALKKAKEQQNMFLQQQQLPDSGIPFTPGSQAITPGSKNLRSATSFGTQVALANQFPGGIPSGQVKPITAVEEQLARDPLSFLPERERLTKELLLCRNVMPFIPPIVLKVNIPVDKQNEATVGNSDIVNNMVELLSTAKFNVQMFPTLDNNLYYIALQLHQQELENEASIIEMKIQLSNSEAKRVFDPQQKGLFQPFRTKDIQQIMLSKLQRLVNMQQYKKKNIILSVLLMHDMFGIHEFKERWWRTSINQVSKRRCCKKFVLPMPLPLISQMYKESINFQFSELSTIKNYFGEKIGFYYAWMSYYTAWLMIPAIPGLAITIYQLVLKDVDTIFTSLYALLVCIWVTIFIERWKRKSAELCLKWGVSDVLLKTGEARVLREEFIGYEYFSHETHNTEKKTYNPRCLWLLLSFQIPIFIILIGLCIATFFGNIQLKKVKSDNVTINKFMSTIAGVINGIVIAIIDKIYSLLATFFVNRENHKYKDTYEKSYVYKIFIFKFVNTNLSLFYTAFNDRDFGQLYYLILGMALTKTVQIFLMKNFKKYISFWIKKIFYFRNVRSSATLQQNWHQSFMAEVEAKTSGGRRDPNQKSLTQLRQEALKEIAVYRTLDETKSPIYQRPVFNANRNQSKQHLLVDYVELNERMPEGSDLVTIYETSEVFILFGLATLYSCACPIIPIIVMVHNVIDINFSLFLSYTTVRRPIAQLSTNIGPWLTIAEFMALAAVLSNCLLLYFSTPMLRQWLEQQMSESQFEEVYLLWILVGIEHFIIIVKQLCAELIHDVPAWVERSQIRAGREDKALALQQQENERQTLLKKIGDKMEEQRVARSKVQNETNQKIMALDRMIKEKDAYIEGLQKALEQTGQAKEEALLKAKQAAMSVKAQAVKESQQNTFETQMPLAAFLGIKQSEWLAKQRSQELDKALTWNFQKRLMHQSFAQIEKEILNRRIGKLLDSKLQSNAGQMMLSGGLQINCAQCSKNMAILECQNCLDHFCKECDDEVHQQMELFREHKREMLNVQVANDRIQSKWKKFEYFNFPVLQDNDHYQNVQLHFHDLRQRYLEMNYIENADKVNLQSLFVDRQYDLLDDIQAKVMMTRDKRIFGDPTEVVSKQQQDQLQAARQTFNDEELYFMNKVAFYLFTLKSDKLTLAQFVKTLGVLQSGPFPQRLALWLKLLSEEAKNTPFKVTQIMTSTTSDQIQIEDQISKSQLHEAFRFSFVQRRPLASNLASFYNCRNPEDIINLIFKLGSSEQQIVESLSAAKITEIVMKNDEIRDAIQCLLQFRPLQASNLPLIEPNMSIQQQNTKQQQIQIQPPQPNKQSANSVAQR